MIDPASPPAAVAATVLALCTAAVLGRWVAPPSERGRFATIDGLRGFLAFSVFLHHSCVWYFYLRSGQWALPPSKLFTQFGQASILLFFMITGFLFFSRVLDRRERPIVWRQLLASRVLRLWPMYLVAIALMLVLVAWSSRGTPNQPLGALLTGIAAWVGFTIYGAPDLNGVAHTAIIVAGVTWTLCYEILFYLSLPLVAALAGAVVPLRVLFPAMVCCTLVWIALRPVQMVFLAPFAAGAAVALLARRQRLREIAARRACTLLALACLASLPVFFSSAYAQGPILLLTIAFAIVACGNDLFGLLLLRASLTLGAMSYSIYLLHGIVLFIAFDRLAGVTEARSWSPLAHWSVVLAATPVLVVVCFATWRWVEMPSMRLARRIAVRWDTDAPTTT